MSPNHPSTKRFVKKVTKILRFVRLNVRITPLEKKKLINSSLIKTGCRGRTY